VRILGTDVRESDAMSYCRYASAERAKVEAFWGPTWAEPVRIRVDAKYKISRALVPAHFGNRGFMEMPLVRMRRNDGALLHEIVHIYAPHANRFLAEGIAVHLHAKLGGNGAFPNHGKPLGPLARRHLPSSERMESLNAVRTPAPLGSVMDEEAAYVLAGSFVERLVERYELAKFKALYETEAGDYEAVYGKSFAVLEQEWRTALKGM